MRDVKKETEIEREREREGGVTIPQAWTFSSGINFSGYTLSRNHLKLLHLSLLLSSTRSDISP